jgi:hypothetical protein
MWVDNGCIKGWFRNAWVTIPQNAYFSVQMGFVDHPGGDGVTFWVWEHHINNGQEVWYPIIQHHKTATGKLDAMTVDLSDLAGKEVYFELRVDAGPTAGQDWAAWFEPSVWQKP